MHFCSRNGVFFSKTRKSFKLIKIYIKCEEGFFNQSKQRWNLVETHLISQLYSVEWWKCPSYRVKGIHDQRNKTALNADFKVKSNFWVAEKVSLFSNWRQQETLISSPPHLCCTFRANVSKCKEGKWSSQQKHANHWLTARMRNGGEEREFFSCARRERITVHVGFPQQTSR